MPRPSRRDEVRATAARLIRIHGYDSATMDLIADEVGLNKGTLYHYYPSKSAILYELLSDQLDATMELLDRIPADATPTERIRALVELQVDMVSTKADDLVVFFQELPWIRSNLEKEQVESLQGRIDRFERFERQVLRAGVRSGEFREQDPTVVMYSIIGILSYVPVWYRGANRQSRKALVREITEFVLHGVLSR
ncbi:TetR family transcriptional regulator [Jatrophihabitans sp. GAS493]|uniref:TetR/AcrR family transcriptional regulator n=1 Tax=Jatrophihabitans sp. GAS493 TaxID=1907575 RepID=UPI000BB9A84B|nr:TetR/AcrR family transcriptional regulator [Jatrophihabitans sp. GAS493]SOD72112.1 TetR family transcriptional regulator [Jatrophihabitans sp. GAS493]